MRENKNQDLLLNKKAIKSVFVVFIALFLFVPIILFFLLSTQPNSTKSNVELNSISQNKNEEEHVYWPEIGPEVKELDLKTLVEQGAPDFVQLQQLFDWAKTFNVDAYSQHPSTAFVEYSAYNPVFDWSLVGAATTVQFKNFITFYGRTYQDDQGQNHMGLENFTSIIFTDTDIEFALPEFWLSLAHYMPNIKTILIKSTTDDHSKMTALPKEIGSNHFLKLEIINENIQDRYENFLYKDSPLSQSLSHLILQNCKISDHIKQQDNDVSYYFTDLLFENYYNLKKLEYLDLSKNQLSVVRGHLLSLPSIVELRLANNQISDWYCVDSQGNEFVDNEHTIRISGLGQRCFPNPTGISYVDVSGNKLSQLVRLKNSEWTNSSIKQYINQQQIFYRSLNFVNLANQIVERDVFVFGNNINFSASSFSDMNIDLSNIYAFAPGLADNEKIEYLSKCLIDRQTTLSGQDPLDPRKWNNLKLTENVLPSMVNLFSWCNNYTNVYESQILEDYSFDSGSPSAFTTTDNDNNPVKFYLKDSSSTLPTNSAFFSTNTSSVIKKGDNPQGANALRACYGNEVLSDYSNFASGVSLDYAGTVHTVDITPTFNVTFGPTQGLQRSSYHYNIQIFNDEKYVFYLTGIYNPETGEPIINDYIKSISDKQITIDEAYEHFNDLIYYVGQENKYEYFKSKFDDRTYWHINFVVNNVTDRVMTINIEYPCSQFIGSNQASAVTKTLNITIPMSPYHDNHVQWILTIIWIVECCFLFALLIPFFYYLIKMHRKTKLLAAQKTEKIKSIHKDSKPKINIQDSLYVDKKLTNKERIENIFNKGDSSKTVKVKIEEKDIKPDSKTSQVLDIDEIVAEIEEK